MRVAQKIRRTFEEINETIVYAAVRCVKHEQHVWDIVFYGVNDPLRAIEFEVSAGMLDHDVIRRK